MNTLGQLVVRLGLDSSEYVSGLTKADLQTRRFVEELRSGFAMSARAAAMGFATITAGTVAAAAAVKSFADDAAALNDLSDITGASVEALSRLRNQAVIAGTDFGTLQLALSKLAAGMAGTDEETSKAKEALKVLGITTRDPAQAMQEAAVKLAGYSDGVNKVGLAVALFGKQGAALLPTLKDMATLQGVAASITSKHAEEAEKLQREFTTLTVEAQAFRNMLAGPVVEALNETIAKMRATITAAGGLGAALKMGLQTSPSESPAAGMAREAKEIERIQRALGRPGLNLEGALGRGLQTQLEDARRRFEFFQKLDLKSPNFDFGPPVLPFTLPDAPSLGGKDDKGGKGSARLSEAQQFLKSLEASVEAAQQLSYVDKVFKELGEGGALSGKDATSDLKNRAFTLAQLRDDIDAAKKAEEERNKAIEAANKSEQLLSQTTARWIQDEQNAAQALRESNAQILEQIEFTKGGQAALDLLTDAKKADAAASLLRKAADLEALGADEKVTKAIRDQAAAIEESRRLAGSLRIAEMLKTEAEAVQNLKADVFDTISRPVEEFIVNGGKARDMLKAIELDLVSFMTRASLMTLKGAFTGAGNAGGFWETLFGSVNWGSLFGGGGGVSGIGFSGGGFGEHFAAGGVSHGGFAMVGENGPELVNLPAGARVYSHPETQRMLGSSTTIHQTINVMPGASTQSARQAAARLRDVTMQALRDR